MEFSCSILLLNYELIRLNYFIFSVSWASFWNDTLNASKQWNKSESKRLLKTIFSLFQSVLVPFNLFQCSNTMQYINLCNEIDNFSLTNEVPKISKTREVSDKAYHMKPERILFFFWKVHQFLTAIFFFALG